MTATVTEAPITEGMQVREFTVRAAEDSEARELVGIAAPYDETYDLGYVRERFERGAFQADGDVLLFSGHDHRSGGLPIGRITGMRDTKAGLEIRARISETPKGDEVYRLAQDGVLTKFSVGFEPVDHRVEDENVIVHTRARLKEVSVVPFPAYQTASISEVRERADDHKTEEESVVETTDNTAVAELRDTIADLERRIAVMADADPQGPSVPQFRSGGDLLKALAAGEDAAREFLTRAADAVGPATSAQANVDAGGAGWINRPLRFVEERRRIVNLFGRGSLPESGNTVEYPEVKSTAGTVTKQSAEGAALSYMEVELGTGSATVGTYGGYSSLSRQAIERGSNTYLDGVLRFQAIQYAKSTNADARAAFQGIVPGTVVDPAKTFATFTAADWISTVIDAAAGIEDTSLGLLAEFMVVSRDVFKEIASLTDSSNRPIFALTGDGQNTLGAANLVTAQFNIAGLPGFVDPGLPANTCKVASAGALTTLESAGAPFRLQDESVVNLTKDFSLYGYAAWTVNDANGVASIDGADAL